MLRQADMAWAGLASASGAGVLGFGLGALLATYFQSYALLIILIGLMMHAWGMYRKHEAEKVRQGAFPLLMDLLYWVCWIVLTVLAIYVLVVAVFK
ncbi:MAG: hypothetical protein AB1529_00885 [Candidatus Micrarchaeota archaeon]